MTTTNDNDFRVFKGRKPTALAGGGPRSSILCAPTVLNYGGGVDSTAMAVELVRLGERPDLILFADTGSEKPETYEYVAMFSDWLVERGFPEITVVRRAKSRPSKTGPGYTTLEGNCLQNKTVPSLAFGRKSCSLKWKAEPMDAHLKGRTEVADTWRRGEKVTKLIGYDCSPADSRRSVGKDEDDLFQYRYPLREWGWDRERCVQAIVEAGLPVPVKSACFFCPASKPWELLWLAAEHPDLFARALEIEDQARPGFTKIEGLWRRAVKSTGRPGSWRAWAELHGLVAPGGTEVIMDAAELRAMARKDLPTTAGTAQVDSLEVVS